MVSQSHKLVIAHVQTRMKRSGGAEENTWAACRHHAEQGHEVHLLAGPDSDLTAYRQLGTDVQIHLIPSLVQQLSPRQDYSAYRELKAFFQTLRPDVVHTHTSKAGIVGRIAAWQARVPAIVHGVHILPFSNVSLSKKLVFFGAEHLTAPFTDHFIHVGQGTHDTYRKALLGPSALHSVVRSGMRVEEYAAAEWPEDWRELLGVQAREEKPTTILMMAALEGRKRHAEFLRGFADKIRPDDHVRLIIAGEGPEYHRLQHLITDLGLDQEV